MLILGVLRALLPDEKARLLQLQVNFLGVIAFQARSLSFDCSLYDSRLLIFTLSGHMVMRLTSGAKRNFLLTVGGFHPAYQRPPLNLARLRRVSLQLAAGDNPRLTLETYSAVTANAGSTILATFLCSPRSARQYWTSPHRPSARQDERVDPDGTYMTRGAATGRR